MTKLKIDLKAGVLEVEGEESFVKEIYQDYKERLSKEDFSIDDPSLDSQEEKELKTKSPTKPKSPGKKNTKLKDGNKRKESYELVKDLDLLTKGGKKALKEFYAEKAPSNAMEKNAVFVYYLQKEAKIKGININHIYTCYKHMNEKVPGALRQSLVDTASRKGWLDTKSMDDITVPTLGENLVEHDLGKTLKEDKKK